MEEKLDDFVKYVTDKFQNLEVKLLDIEHDSQRTDFATNRYPPRENLIGKVTGHVASSTAPEGATGDNPTHSDIQGDFQSLKDALSRIKLPADFRLNETRQGIRRNDQPLFSALSKCARYNETLVKLLTTLQPGSTLD